MLEEQLHNESIINIKCQSHSLPRHSGDIGTPEEIYVLYNTVVCILQGFTLFSTLRAYRNHLARGIYYYICFTKYYCKFLTSNMYSIGNSESKL